MQVILDSSFARPGSAPIRGGKKGEFRDWTRNVLIRGQTPPLRHEAGITLQMNNARYEYLRVKVVKRSRPTPYDISLCWFTFGELKKTYLHLFHF